MYNASESIYVFFNSFEDIIDRNTFVQNIKKIARTYLTFRIVSMAWFS